jgi:crossover junction endodeoxyribonuclease RusA
MITLPLPTSTNRLYRVWRGRPILSREGRAFKAAAALLAKAAGVKPLSGPVQVFIRVYRRRRAGDLDGFLKSLLDACNGVLFEDDSQVVAIHAVRLDDKVNPRAEIEVLPACSLAQ